jgi:predicted Zn-dependent peptidase
MGNNNDIELLGELLLKDICNKCRAHSAAAFLQIWRDRFDDTQFYEKAMPYLKKAILQEKDYYVINHIIYALRNLTKKTFGISNKTIDEIILYEGDFSKEEIDKSKNKIIRYFERLNK